MSPEQTLHTAICQAVSILNTEPEIIVIESGRRIRDILRMALADYADAVMDEPAKTGEVEHMKRLHRLRKRAPSGSGSEGDGVKTPDGEQR
jgi:hypothetical protein